MSKNKILIVDDEIMNVNLLEDILEDQNYLIETAYSGEDALEVFSVFNPDLVLLDVMMPGIDGYEVCREIRTDAGPGRFTKVIMISGRTMLEERLQGYEAGADDYLTKPIVEEELLAKIAVFMQLKKSEEVDQIKSDLLTLFSHEAKTPINAIFGYAEILGESPNLTEDEKEYSLGILESGRQLLVFVEKASLLCELKKGMNLDYMAQNIEEDMRYSITKFKGIISEKKLEVKVHGSSLIYADWSLLGKVFEYLIDNAIKFSNSNGVVDISIESEDSEQCIVKISDKGEGIPGDWIKSIFDPFAIRNINHHHKGQGLSLAICRYILEQHQGTIDVESSLGQGTTFIIKIPKKLEYEQKLINAMK